jgi:hypothetical protein
MMTSCRIGFQGRFHYRQAGSQSYCNLTSYSYFRIALSFRFEDFCEAVEVATGLDKANLGDERIRVD